MLSPFRAAAAAALLVPLAVVGPAAATHDGSGPHARPTDDSCPAARVQPAFFADVPRDSAHRAAVDCVVWWEVATGRGPQEYAPAADVSRAQMATFLRNLVQESGGTLPTPTKDHFSDDDGSFHEPSINVLAEAGIVAGRGDGSYAPDAPVERGAMATFLVNAYEYRSDRTLAAPTDDAFSDDDGTRHEASTNTAAAAGFAAGLGDRSYAPRRLVHRDQMASFLTRVLDLLVEDGLAEPPASAAGDVDPGFGDGGRTTVDFGDVPAEARAVAVGRDGTLAVAGSAAGHVAVARLRADGTPDTTFGDQGKVVTPILVGSQAEAVAVQEDGRIVVAGWTSDDPAEERYSSSYAVARYRVDGSLDPTFDGDGVRVFTNPFSHARLTEVLLLPDGRLVVGGSSLTMENGDGRSPSYVDDDMQVLVLLPDGSLDTSVAYTGSIVFKREGHDSLDGLALQPDGDVVVGGLSVIVKQAHDDPYDAEVRLTRFAPDGGPGSGPFTYGPTADTAGLFTRVGGIAVQSSGAIVAAGGYATEQDSPPSLALVRHDSAGAFDRSFGQEGLALTSAAPQSVGNSLAVDGSDRIVVAGTAAAADGTAPGWVVTRHSPDGEVDEAFGDRGAVRTAAGTVANAVVLQGSDIVVAGCDCAYAGGAPQGPSRFVVARLRGEAPAGS